MWEQRLMDRRLLGWHSRGYLPHFDEPGLVQGITFRLADSLPRSLIERWAEELGHATPNRMRTELARRIAEALDHGRGECLLRHPRVGRIVEDALLHFDAERYSLLAWCVMPNHVHALIEPRSDYALSQIVHTWKSFTASQCNRVLHRTGAFWSRDYYDRFIRSSRHLEAAAAYIEHNPVKAGLVQSPEDWPWSSARFRESAEVHPINS